MDVRPVEDGLAVGERLLGTLQDLLEVRVLHGERVGIDVERNRVLGKPEGVQAALETAKRHLEILHRAAEHLHLGAVLLAVNALQAQVAEDLHGFVCGRRDGVRDHPVVGRAHAGARGPLAVAERLNLVGVEVAALEVAGVLLVRLAGGERHRVEADLRELHGGVGELRLVLVIDVDRGLIHEHFGHGGRPIDVGVPEKPVVARQRREVVTPGIAVALRILRGGTVDVHHAIPRADAVVVDVGGLALGHALREVPQEAVEVGRGRELRELRRRRAATEERQLLVEERRHLVREAEDGLRAEERVELAHAGRCEDELLREVDILAARRDEDGLRLVEDRLVELKEADLGEVVVVERDVPLVGTADLLEHREGDVARIRVEVLHALREGRHGIEDALHPALGELLIRPAGPAGADRRGGERPLLGAVAHRVVGVHVVLHGRIFAKLNRGEAGLDGGCGLVRPRGGVLVGRERSVGVGRRVLPLELVVVRGIAERRAVEERQALGELVERIGEDGDPVEVQLGFDADDVHRDGKTWVHDRLVGVVVLDERYPTRAEAVGYERVVVLRLVFDRRQDILRLPLEVSIHVVGFNPCDVGAGDVVVFAQFIPVAENRGEAGQVVVALGRPLLAGLVQALPLVGRDHGLRNRRRGGVHVERPVRARDGTVHAVRRHHRHGVRLDEIEPHVARLLRGEDVVEVALALDRERLCRMALGGGDGRRRQRVDGGVPLRLLRGRRGADRLQRLAFRVGENVELEVRAAGLLLDELSDQVHPLRNVRVRVDVEAVGDRRRQAREVVLAFAEEARAGGAEREAVFGGEVPFDRERLRLRHGRVDDIDHGRGGRIGGRLGVRIRNRHRRGVPDFGKPQRRLREHLRHPHRRHAVRRRPCGDPVPRRRRRHFLEVLLRGVRNVDAVHPADARADGKLVGAERRAVEALLHRVGVERRRRAVAPRPRRALAVQVDDVHVVRERDERRIGVVPGLRPVELADGSGRDHSVAGDDRVREGRVGGRLHDDAVRLHRALAVLRVLREDDRLRGCSGVEVVAHRPDDIVAVELQEGVLLVRVPADRLPVVLPVDRRLHARIGAESAVEIAGAAAPAHCEAVCDELVAVAGAVRRRALGVVAGRGREVGLGEEEADGIRRVRSGRIDTPDREVVERNAAGGPLAAVRAERERRPRSGPAVRQREGDVRPAVDRDVEGILHGSVKRAREEEVRIGNFDERNDEGGAVQGHGRDTSGRHVGREVGGIDLEADDVRDAGERHRAAHLGEGARVDERERAAAEGRHLGIGGAELRRKHDFREKPLAKRLRPREAIALDKSRIGNRRGHVGKLDVPAPPHFDMVRAFVDTVDRRFETLVGIAPVARAGCAIEDVRRIVSHVAHPVRGRFVV